MLCLGVELYISDELWYCLVVLCCDVFWCWVGVLCSSDEMEYSHVVLCFVIMCCGVALY